MSLYLKYRPTDLSDIVNQKHIVEILAYQSEYSKFSNNYIFYWPRGTGKTSSARILAKALNCENKTAIGPCNTCPKCEMISTWKAIDIIEIDAASHTQVDNIRQEIIDKSIYQPSYLDKKVYIIDEVHMLSKPSFNALLKIMEEPPPYIVFILATTAINKVPDTIVSRAQVFNFRKLSSEDIFQRLKYINQYENLNISNEILSLISRNSDWAMRDSIKYLEQISSIKDLNIDKAYNTLWITQDDSYDILTEFFYNKNFEGISMFFDDLLSKWTDFLLFLNDYLKYINNKFIDNPVFYSNLVNIINESINSIRYISFPVVSIKAIIYKNYFQNDIVLQTINQNNFDQSKMYTECNTKQKDNISKNKNKDTKEQSFTESNRVEIDKTDLFDKLLSKISNIALKSILKNYVEIDKIWLDYNSIDFVIINDVQYDLITKKENVDLISNILSELLSITSIKVNFKYLSKEEFLGNKLV